MGFPIYDSAAPQSSARLSAKMVAEGLVLKEWEQNGYSDSDWYVTYWDEETGRPHTVEYATTRGGSVPASAKVDATPAVRFLADRWYAAAARATSVTEGIERLKLPHLGALVRVARGRKVPRGLTGRVIAESREIAHVSKYGTWTTYRTMLLIETDAGTWKVDADHCDVIEPSAAFVQELFDLAEAA